MADGLMMFEIYRDSANPATYRLVVFTDLDERHRDTAIERALCGEHVAGGFLPADHASRDGLAALVRRLNAGESLDQTEVEHVIRVLGEAAAHEPGSAGSLGLP
jgi:hypothetical protein